MLRTYLWTPTGVLALTWSFLSGLCATGNTHTLPWLIFLVTNFRYNRSGTSLETSDAAGSHLLAVIEIPCLLANGTLQRIIPTLAMPDWEKLEGFDENLPVTHHNDVYPAIDPQQLYTTQAYQGKVVLITGASRGIGQEISLQYARAGAVLAITARAEDALEETKSAILAAVPSAQVLVHTADVRDVQGVERVVQAVLARFGKLDVLVANAGAISPFGQKLDEKDPNAWWNTFEVNIRGSFNFFRAAAAALEQSRGYFVATSSTGAQVRIPGTSDMNISKNAVNRLIEFIVLEYPSVHAFALSPGIARTRLLIEARGGEPLNTVELPAATTLYLTSGRADWLSGKFYSTNWDIAEVERDWKDAILKQKALVNRLSIPGARRDNARL